jgi:protein-S-isoprenylcysteine O-methyltransferase Ste14
MPLYAYLILAVGWIVWLTPFVVAKRASGPARVLDRRARWGLVLVGIGYALLWQGRFWERPLPTWRLVLTIVFQALAGVFSWTGTRALGRQLRVDAGLSSDHELITHGVYRVVRHPIYASMLCLLLGTGFALTSWPLLAGAIAFFIVGTEIRIRIEERLLVSAFGDRYEEYRRKVRAYIPLVR